MRYYTIQDEQLITADKEEALTRYYNNVLPLPEDYEYRKYIVVDGELVLNPNWEKEKEEAEKIRVNNLYMTPLDFIKVLEGLGVTLEQINAFLESNLDIKMQLTYCNNVYCGVVKTFLPITIGGVTLTDEIVEQIFKSKG